MPRNALVVGAGCFGISTAYSLLKRGISVTIIDRSSVLPAPDAASTDINKICRSDYGDPIYAKLAREAILEYRKPEWKGLYHESGLLCAAPKGYKHQEEAFKNVNALGLKNSVVESAEHFKMLCPNQDVLPLIHEKNFTYLNREGGWAESGAMVKLMMGWCIDLGASLIPGQKMKGYTQKDGQVNGIVTEEGRTFEADIIVLALGAWSEETLYDTGLTTPKGFLTASGHGIMAIQLDETDRKKYANMPTCLDRATGYYLLPPNSDGIVKCAFHGPGYLFKPDGSDIPRPRTNGNLPMEKAPIPKQNLQNLREALRLIYPYLADREVAWTRLCFYTDSPDSDFLIAPHPKYSNVHYATAGSGHGFKFFSVLGEYSADSIQGKLDPILARKWGFENRGSDLGGPRSAKDREDLLAFDMTQEEDMRATDT